MINTVYFSDTLKNIDISIRNTKMMQQHQSCRSCKNYVFFIFEILV